MILILQYLMLKLSIRILKIKPILVCKRRVTNAMKPPNILIKTNCQQTFQSWCKILNTVLQPETYITYHITDETFCKQPWIQSCALLIHTGPITSAATKVRLEKYLNVCSGKVLFHDFTDNLFSSAVLDKISLKNQNNGVAMSESYTNKDSKVTAIILRNKLSDITQLELLSVLKDLDIQVEENIEPLPVNDHGYLFATKPNISVSDMFEILDKFQDISSGINICGKDIKLNFIDKSMAQPIKADNNTFTVQTNFSKHECKFNWQIYKIKLRTKYLGKQLIYTDVIPSTQDLFTKFNVNTIKVNGLVIAARQQTKGKGRSGNKWLSPVGCMMFSTQVHIPSHSKLAQKLPFIQHIAVVALIKAIKLRHGYDKLDINIKWPNDIYIRKNTKIGGVIVNSSFWKNTFKVTVGLGVNVCNEKPTECINSLINEYNELNDGQLKALVVEDLLASTLNEFEHLIDMFQLKGEESFKDEYYEYWMHSNAEVKLECRNNETAIIIGLDEFGYLLVRLENGLKVSLQPDGNSFDMMTNMITQKF